MPPYAIVELTLRTSITSSPPIIPLTCPLTYTKNVTCSPSFVCSMLIMKISSTELSANVFVYR